MPDAPRAVKWDLCLYVADETIRSLNTIENVKRICKNHLKDDYSIEIINLVEHPEIAARDQIVALPTLVRRQMAANIRIVGDLSSDRTVLKALGVR